MTNPKTMPPSPHDGATREQLLQRRLELERERAEILRTRGSKYMHRSAPRFPEFWFEKALNWTGLRRLGERNALDFRLREVECVFENLPPAFDGFRILHLTDLHFREDCPEFTERLCGFLAPVEADLCALTGDYRFTFTGPFHHVMEGIDRVLKAVQPVHGAAAVLGNHDGAAFVDPLRELGATVLMNERFALSLGADRIWIAGVDDPHRYRCDNLPLALGGVPPEAFTLLLAHSPELASTAPDHGIDLYLCGHTHCGQVCLPGGKPIVVNARAARRYCVRAWRNGRTRGYTAAGLGTTDIPVRFFCPPEAALIRLRRGAGG